ncbi:hypothetical protein [Leptolyngbya ohadii]|uniref:hypothetical protein n=1 Tax=Leptolyngbya ohadii TaxID=1962290 RepID=UPI000B599623|nr:hypothetical protein [Leptolyngbya ohadii]
MSTSPFDPEFDPKDVDPEEILDCARSIRPALPELLEAGAESFDRQLAELLAEAKAGQPVEDEILRLLRSHPNTEPWTAEYLRPKTNSRGFTPLPGSIGSVSAQKYVCPHNDYIWYRRSIGIPIPACPSHPELGALIPED